MRRLSQPLPLGAAVEPAKPDGSKLCLGLHGLILKAMYAPHEKCARQLACQCEYGCCAVHCKAAQYGRLSALPVCAIILEQSQRTHIPVPERDQTQLVMIPAS